MLSPVPARSGPAEAGRMFWISSELPDRLMQVGKKCNLRQQSRADRSISLVRILFHRYWTVFLEAALRHHRGRFYRLSPARQLRPSIHQPEQEPSHSLLQGLGFSATSHLNSYLGDPTPPRHKGDKGDFPPFDPHIHQVPTKSR